MNKFLILILQCGFIFSCLSEKSIASDASAITCENTSLMYLQSGNAHLLTHNPEAALENFESALASLHIKYRSAPITKFMIFFSQIIAYDSLELKDECEKAMGALLLCMNQTDQQKNDISKCSKNHSPSSEDCENFLEIFRELITIAPSIEVKQFLSSIVNDMNEALNSSFQLIDQNNNSSLIPELECKKNKHFWNKVCVFFDNCAEWIKVILKYKAIADELVDIYEAQKQKSSATR